MIIISWDIGIKNLAYIIIDYNNNNINILSWNNINIFDNYINNCKHCIDKEKNINKIDIFNFKYHIIFFLESNHNILFNNINIILIENQPSLKNPRMKMVSDMIYDWYLIKYNNIKINNINYPKIEIKLLAPSTKFYIINDLYKKLLKSQNKKKKYQFNKKLSITLCNIIIGDNKYIRYYLSIFNKYDDLCDVFI
jgi:hypothetical protein